MRVAVYVRELHIGPGQLPLVTVLVFVNDPVDLTKNTFPPPGPISPTTHSPPSAHVGGVLDAVVGRRHAVIESATNIAKLFNFMRRHYGVPQIISF